MNILIVNFEYPPLGGGGGIATKQLAEELAKRHIVHVLTTAYENAARNEDVESVFVHRVKVAGRKDQSTSTLLSLMTFAPMALVKGWLLCRKIHFDVINAQFVVPSGLPAAVLALVFHIPFVLSFIGADVYDPTRGISPHKHWYLRTIIRWIANRATLCTAISEDTKRRAQSLHGVQKEIIVTHLGIVPMQIRQVSRQSVGFPKDIPIALSIGRLIPRKGYGTLLKAWQSVPDALLIVVGEGPLRDPLENMASELGIHNRVVFKGSVSELEKLQMLRAADLYVSASLHEGFGIVYLEAMDAGLPIVTPNEGGQIDFLQDGVNAILVEPNNPVALSQAIISLVNDTSRMTAMGRANRKRVKEFYLEKTAKKFENVLVKAKEAREANEAEEATS